MEERPRGRVGAGNGQKAASCPASMPLPLLLKRNRFSAEQRREKRLLGKGGRSGGRMNGFCVLTYLLRNAETA